MCARGLKAATCTPSYRSAGCAQTLHWFCGLASKWTAHGKQQAERTHAAAMATLQLHVQLIFWLVAHTCPPLYLCVCSPAPVFPEGLRRMRSPTQWRWHSKNHRYPQHFAKTKETNECGTAHWVGWALRLDGSHQKPLRLCHPKTTSPIKNHTINATQELPTHR